MSSKNFIDALVSGNTEAIQTEFDAIMQEKVQNRLETFRQEVSQNLFVSEEEQSAE